ncbi:alpha/beta hydrolase [Tamlana sp. 2_MG-2023]|uniref:alpha/beta hydrolase n=1 Tax=unclassified Tamlana TaxID=2614803 RepID=UPI0026E24E80|nr:MULTISPECIES: alpha/beta hydrolase [unclassified Tamlana]MDO6759488.1 alpha/beta hydrolase [Tamlana sp. 2_MG-2023]MDO6790373.1 alpha/beta hydrolase [Tamlana sp. 1_MG-2023]
MPIFRLSILFFLIFYSVSAQTRYIDSVFDSINVRTYNYAIKANDTLKLDIYQPARDSISKKPLMVLVHGGGFYTGKRNESYMVSMAKNIARKGYNVASIDYRLTQGRLSVSCGVPQNEIFQVYKKGAQDVMDALLFLTDYKTDFNIDASKIVLAGSSAGAETILNIAYNRHLMSNSARHQAIKIAAVFSISGAIFDTNAIEKHNSIPGIFYHGEKDPIVPYGKGAHHSCTIFQKGFFVLEGSEKITDKLASLNTSFILYTYRGRGHDIFNLPTKDYHQAFIFLKNVLFNNTFYQSKIRKTL